MRDLNNSDFYIFFDDGGVLNDNRIRGKQWKKYCGEFFYSLFGGNPENWAKANHKVITKYLDIFWKDWRGVYPDYLSFYGKFKVDWVNEMFKEVGNNTPPNVKHEELYDETTQYVIPKIRSAIPGVIKSIKLLFNRGFKLFTASGGVSEEIKMYLNGMGIRKCFSGFYGPDLINISKSGKDYYSTIFKDLNINPRNAIIIDDQPRFLEVALQTDANIIQSCITGEFEPQYPFYVKKMKNLPKIITDLLDFHNL